MSDRRERILDTAIELIGSGGIHAVTHRAVDTAADLPRGSTSNYYRTRGTLLNGVVKRFAERERANWELTAAQFGPTTPLELAAALVAFARAATDQWRTLTLARYAILVEAAVSPSLRAQLLTSGAGVNAWFTAWLRLAGSTDPERDAPLIMNHWTGLVLHELAVPDPAFDPTEQLTALITSLIRPRPAEVPT